MLSVLSRWLPRLRFSRRHFGDLFHYGANITAVRVVYFFNHQIDRLLVGYVLGATALGHFGMARRVADGAVNGLAGVMNTVAFPVLSRLQDDRERLVQAFRSATHFASLIIFPAFAGLALVAPVLVDVFLRPEWRPMGGVLQILSLGAMVVSVNWVLGAIIRATGRADLSFRISLFSTFLKIVLCVLAVPFGIEAVAVAFVIVSLSVHPIMLYLVRKIVGVRFREIAAELAPAAVSTVIMSTCVAATHMVLTGQISSGARLGALIAVGVVTYGAALFVTARRSLLQLVHGFPR
jgi:PST family polysaccharide transporter